MCRRTRWEMLCNPRKGRSERGPSHRRLSQWSGTYKGESRYSNRDV
ncbi:hypothetical protein PF003_g20409 [Phytophthora fragariae]|nr:hypothetical protein PF003_g20409 [Phytophthora fragariae]